MTESPTPPAWVRKRDGSRVPFDADRISQALFAATETLGHPDAFLARELTDGVLHFLAVEKDDDALTTVQIADIVEKTVRELGQPALAKAFSTLAAEPRAVESASAAIVLHAPLDMPPRMWFPSLVRAYSQQAIYSRQVLAAQSDGLLALTGLETPGELEACVVGSFESAAEALLTLRGHVGGCAVFDGPEFALLKSGTEHFVTEVCLASRFLQLPVVVNLNCDEPPPWAGDLARGPLFAAEHAARDETKLAEVADKLLECFAAAKATTPAIRIYWHVGARDFLTERLRKAAHLALEGRPLTFVFDRPRRPPVLAEGVDRQHPAVLLTIALQLPRLASQPGLREDAPLFLQKLGSLTRLALSAAVQKREYLRRLERTYPSPLTTGFLLDRARLVVAPVGLDDVVQQLFGRGLTAGGATLDLGKQIITRLRDVLKQDGRTVHLDACVDARYEFALGEAAPALKTQLRAAGVLHALAERGTVAFIPGGDAWAAETLIICLRQAWENSEVAALCLSSERQYPDQ
jgi:hypothetical protein